jgi:formate dehydrogenase subunit delta
MDAAYLAYMANQIARNLAAQGEKAAIAATAQHIRDFWDPRIKAAILDDLDVVEPVVKSVLIKLMELEGRKSTSNFQISKTQ